MIVVYLQGQRSVVTVVNYNSEKKCKTGKTENERRVTVDFFKSLERNLTNFFSYFKDFLISRSFQKTFYPFPYYKT